MTDQIRKFINSIPKLPEDKQIKKDNDNKDNDNKDNNTLDNKKDIEYEKKISVIVKI